MDPVVRPAVAVAVDSAAVFAAHRHSVLHLFRSAYTAAQLDVGFAGRTPAIYGPAIQAGQLHLAEIGAGAGADAHRGPCMLVLPVNKG